MRQRLCALSLVALASLLSPSIPTRGHASELTDVIDAADGRKPFDFTGQVRYRRSLRRAKITREYHCNRHPYGSSLEAINRARRDESTCPNSPTQGELTNVKELRYERVTHEMIPELRFGLWKDLELKIEMPIVLQDEQMLRYAGDGGDIGGNSRPITAAESSIAPEAPYERMINIPANGPMSGLPTRAGFGDMLFMLRFAPISSERNPLEPGIDPSRGDWVLELGYRAPTGSIMRYGNEAVGRGVHELIFASALSRNLGSVEPYLRLEGRLPVGASGKSYFQDYGGTQEEIGHSLPGGRVGFDFGVELTPYFNQREHIRFYLDRGLGASYQAEGRDYSELFDALALGARSCGGAGNTEVRDGKPNCAYYNKDIPSDLRDQPFDGITTVEEFMILRAHLGLGFYVSKYFRIGADFSLAHETEHFLTNGEIGKDLDGDGVVYTSGSNRTVNTSEHNPTFVPNLDYVGRRIRVEETTLFQINTMMTLIF
ncbi:MAG: hypothetical protein VYD19_10840 [Myxococcota bacterium]|nr:hypothetical protein [Myxococcota bacterium]